MVRLCPDRLGRWVKVDGLDGGKSHALVAEMGGLLLLHCLEGRRGGMDGAVVCILRRLLFLLLLLVF